MAGEKLSEAQLAEFRESFSLFDKNKDDTIDKNELGMVIRSLGLNPTGAELDAMIAEIDLNANGTIEFNEFCNLMAKTLLDHPNADEEMMEAFRRFDRNNDGYVDAKEIEFVMQKIGDKMTKEEAQEMVNEADVDGDGRINYEEFVAIMCQK
ncbi:neo-calmodulin-like [Glandiceps talaboti]